MDFTKVKEALERRGFKVSVFETGAEAAEYLNGKIDGTTVSFGGSMTLRQMGMFEKLSSHNTIYDHWNVPAGANADEIREKAMTTETYVSSVNGLSETGEIINIDGTGNRVASTIFGHSRLFLVVGSNKLALTFEEAMWRARNIAAPMNAKRLERKTPCAVDGKCHDCNSPECICNVISIHRHPGRGTDTEVVLINETLGY